MAMNQSAAEASSETRPVARDPACSAGRGEPEAGPNSLRAVIALASDAIVLTDERGTITEWNESAARISGLQRDQALGRPAWEVMSAFFPPGVAADLAATERARRLRAALDRTLLDGTLPWRKVPIRTVFRRRDGETRIAELHPRTVGTGTGYVIACVGRDVTDRVRAERAARTADKRTSPVTRQTRDAAFAADTAAALRESEERYRTVADFTADWEYWETPDGALTYVSPSCERVTGYSASDFTGDRDLLLRIVHPDDVAAVAEHQEQHAGTRDVGSLEHRIIRRDGTTRWIDHVCQRVFGDDGRYLGRRASNRDSTARREAADVLREQEALLRRTFDQSPLGKAIVSLDFRFVRVNDALCRILGRTAADLQSHTFVEITHPDDRAVGIEGTRALLDGRISSLEQRKRYLRGDGSYVWARTSVAVIRNGDGRPLHLLPVIEDITERKRAEEEAAAEEEVLRLCSGARSTRELMQALAWFLGCLTDCEAIGIRIRQGEDFPYFETRGFPEPFVEAERRLCATDPKGEPLRDSTGNPVLECMCGNVLCGRFDPLLPFFTPGGSFWSNGTTQLLATTTEEDRQARTRDRCNGEGYESVALVPLRARGETYGLLQFNDSREGMFSPERIRLLERLADNVAMALAKLLADDALLASEEKYRQLVELAQEGIWSIDADWLTTFVNPRMAAMLGLAAEEMIGKPVSSFFPSHPAAASLPATCHPPGRNAKMAHLVRPDGTQVPVSVHVAQFPSADGAFIGAVAVVTDLTAVRAAEVERLTLEVRVQQAEKLESLGVLTGGIAHDFNNLLQAVLGNAELALAEIPRGSPGRAEIEGIETAARRAAALVRKMLAYSGRGRFCVEAVDLSALIAEMQQQLAASVSLRTELRLELQPDLPLVGADADQLRQVVANLVANASEAVERRGGTITLATNVGPAPLRRDDGSDLPAADGHPNADGTGSARMVSLVVRDDGVGIDEATKARIFEPFFTTKFSGRGLGLAAVLGIVQRHRGTIDVESAVGKGSTFTVRLPVLSPMAIPMTHPDSASSGE
jgi:two-component system, cell cycle sensor histidine kinase and response regulator CckA